ncbi:EAL domain-containing protein [Rhizobium sp. YIM 134829]|uniref:bifunctional diguanylate cyclase/phosphodiesterase n=1 Tax=Rhizobium sp. YIM 134829 TaxID=3390453 RepID=UPI00397DE2D3
MIRVVTCLFGEHDLLLVALAVLLCLISSLATFLLLARARQTEKLARATWIVSGGMAGGFGIWATHFVAMLAYDPGLTLGYHAGLTLASLAIAIIGTATALVAATLGAGAVSACAAGIIFAMATSAMHFVGMAGIDLQGVIVWERELVVAAIVLAAVFAIPAFLLAERGARGLRGVVPSALLMLCGIASLHFTAMGAVTPVLLADALPPAETLSRPSMVLMIATVAFSLLFSGLAAVVLARRAERRALAGERAFRLLVANITDYAIYLLTPAGIVANWNAGAERTKGYKAEEVVGQHFSTFYPAEDRAAGLPQHSLDTALRKGTFEAEGWRLRKDGSRFWAHVVIDPVYDEEGRHLGFAKITRDCTERMQDAARLKQASDNLSIALNTMNNAICLYDAEERLILHNERLRKIFGIPASVVLTGRTFRELCHARYEQDFSSDVGSEEFYQQHRALFTRAGGGEHLCTTAGGKFIRTVHSPTGDGSFVTTVEDITSQVKSEAQMAFITRHDGLTGLPNRLAVCEKLDTALPGIGSDERMAVLSIDLHGFKDINDGYGHGCGDTILRMIAERIQAAAKPQDVFGRIGGDDFVVARIVRGEAELTDFIARMSDLFKASFSAGDVEVQVGASFGIAVYPDDAPDREKLLSNADLALARAKAKLEERICFYEPAMDEAARNRRFLQRDLWRGLDESQFHLAYQVQRDTAGERISGYEALLRWRHPTRGPIGPDVFIPIAEECGAIIGLGEFVIRQACRDAMAFDLVKVAVNLSPLQLGSIKILDTVRNALTETGLSPDRLELEVTESAVIGDRRQAIYILGQLKTMGVTIAIDDFGTGYSSLETLRSFPFDKVKLDRSFLTGIDGVQSRAFVRAMVALGKSLGVAVLAEGVETAEQFQVLVGEGCDEVQGYLFGRPMPIGELGLPRIAAQALSA